MENLSCKVPEAELTPGLGNVEMDIVDSLQVVCDVTVGLDSVSVSGAFCVRKRPGESPASLRQLCPC